MAASSWCEPAASRANPAAEDAEHHGERGIEPVGGPLKVLPSGAMLEPMVTLKAHVKNGQLVIDEPTELPEGAEADVILHVADPHDELYPEERAELNGMLGESLEELEQGKAVDGEAFLAELRSRL
jgi:hypothetical protein